MTMNKINYKILNHIFVVLLLTFVIPMRAASPQLNARLDSTTLLMGRMTILNLELVKDENKPGKLLILERVSPEGLISLLGDSVELRAAFTSDTVKLGSGRLQINYRFPLQSFDSGAYQLPEFEYAEKFDTARSNRVMLKVVPVKATANDSISPMVGPMAPFYNNSFEKFTDKIPDLLYYYWWLILLAIIAVAFLIWAILRYRKTGVLLRPKPQPSPYETAIKKLNNLKGAKLWEQGLERDYFTRLTDILREYLQGRFGINAMEMTSAQILDTLHAQKDLDIQKRYVEQILKIADFVKFAKMRPLPDDNIEAFTNALRFVEETKPVETIEKVNDKTGKEGKS